MNVDGSVQRRLTDPTIFPSSPPGRRESARDWPIRVGDTPLLPLTSPAVPGETLQCQRVQESEL